ncbi:hypothetical protein [Sinobacterium caligoides]|nr:hypothetical protein [Sinobacterium caligoides]
MAEQEGALKVAGMGWLRIMEVVVDNIGWCTARPSQPAGMLLAWL